MPPLSAANPTGAIGAPPLVVYRTISVSAGASFVAPLALVHLLASGCARTSEGSGTTTVTSGSTSGVRVTGARVELDQASMRLSDEMCARELACSHIGDGARYRTEEACMADQAARASVQIGRWSCTPRATQASFQECLAAIRGERCETTLTRADELVVCRSMAVCGR